MQKQGCVPVGCAAFIGEHSFSAPETPVGAGRPDTNDLELAQTFGRKVKDALAGFQSVDTIPEITVTGAFPYKETPPKVPVDFIAVSDDCTQCGTCEEVCPVNAIDLKNDIEVNQETCIRCCACIKICPEQARSVKPSPIKDIAIRLTDMCQTRKEPVFFF